MSEMRIDAPDHGQIGHSEVKSLILGENRAKMVFWGQIYLLYSYLSAFLTLKCP